MVKRIGIRFNLDKEYDLRIWEFLQDLNLEQHKSINKFILMCIDGYINQFTAEQEQTEFIDKVISAIRTELQQSAGINLLKYLISLCRQFNHQKKTKILLLMKNRL